MTASTTQMTPLCGRCFSVLKDILHLTESQAEEFEQKAFFSDACVRDFCFSANPHEHHRDANGEKSWKEAADQASFVTRCSFYLSGVSSNSVKVGEDFPDISELLQAQATVNTEEPHSREISEEFLDRKRHHQWDECEKAACHKQNLVQHQGVCSGIVHYECHICGIVFRCIANLNRHKRLHNGENPMNVLIVRSCSVVGLSSLDTTEFTREKNLTNAVNVEYHSVEVITFCAIREFLLGKSHINVVIVGSASVKGLTSFNTSKFTLVRHYMSVLIVGSHLGKFPLSKTTREFTLEKSLMSVGNVGNHLEKNILSQIIREFTLEKSHMSVVNVGNCLHKDLF